MKIIFLDIDGVLNSTRSSIALNNSGEPHVTGGLCFSTIPGYEIKFTQEYFKLDPIAVALLKRVVEDSSAKIVISSTWRIGSCLEHFVKMFECYGWDTKDIIIDLTSEIRVAGTIRGHEVEKWLQSNAHLDITHYVIVDDNSDFLPSQKEHFVQTNMNIGFSHITHFQILEKLGAVSSA